MILGWCVGILVLLIVISVVIYLRKSFSKHDSNITETSEDNAETGSSEKNNSNNPFEVLLKNYNSPKMSAYSDYKAYLNHSSTSATKTGIFNSADLAYPAIMNVRKEYIKACDYIKKYVNAPSNAKVLINSGATESIANMVWWCKKYMENGVLLGSDYDHDAVKSNCENMEVIYRRDLKKSVLPENTSMIFLTHVDSKTGNILNVSNYKKNVIDRYHFTADYTNDEIESNNPFTLQYRPILAVDVTQSITKIPIDMKGWGANAVFFSLHKLGGPMGFGVLVIADSYNDKYCPKFKPLICGFQQYGMRGGTWDMEGFIDAYRCIKDNHKLKDREMKWVEGYEKLEDAGVKIVKPDKNHLYNTYLIEINRCPLGIIHALARKGIYVGNVSACSNEAINARNNRPDDATFEEIRKKHEAIYGGGNDSEKTDINTIEEEKRYIRLSFNDKNDFTMETLDEVIEILKAAESTE